MRKPLTPEQREKQNAYSREWRKKNLEKKKAANREWQKNNREKQNAYHRKWLEKTKKAEANKQVHMFETTNTAESINIKGDSTMNTELQIFNYTSEGVEKEVRTVQVNNDTWWVLKDVCDVLGLSNPSMIADRLDEDEKEKIDPKQYLGSRSNEPITIISESGLYNVILLSRKPEAKQFKRWVTHEVLPAIRKTGSYHQPMATEDIMIYQLTELKKIKQRQIEQQLQLDTVSTRLDGMKDVISLNTTSWRDDCRKIIVRIAEKMGGHSYIQLVNADIYKLLDMRAGCSLQVRLTNKKRRMADEGICKSKRDKVTRLDIVADDKKLIEIYVAIVKEMALKYDITLPNNIEEVA